MNWNVLVIIIAAALAGCAAGQYRPVIDPQSCQDCDYVYDLASCRALAEKNTHLAANAVGGAAVGAGLFALLGAAAGIDAGEMAGIGAAIGGLHGAGNEAADSRAMVAKCMAGRGYSVLR